jgi:nucleotide-binding universal stress UspA family protein
MAERPRVVVAIDGSVRSEASLEWAIDETDLLGGQLLVVHAFSYPYGDGGETLSSARDLMRVDATRRLDQAVERARARGGAEVDGRLAEGRPGAEIVTSADGADLIVVGTRQRSAALHVAVLASVAEAVISHAPCPVAVVREGLIAPTP